MTPSSPLAHNRRARVAGRWIAPGIVAALAMAGCSVSDDSAADSAADSADSSATTEPLPATVTTEMPDAQPPEAPSSADNSGPSIVMTPNPNNVLSGTVTIVSTEPVSVTVTATSDGHIVNVPQTATTATGHDIPLVGLRSDRTYEIHAALIDADGVVVETISTDFSTGSIPDRFVPYEFSADAERTSPGYTIIEMQTWRDPRAVTPQKPFDDPQYLVALDSEGEIVWYYENGPVIGGVEQTATGNFTSYYFPNGVREFDILGNEVGDWVVPIENADGPQESGGEPVEDRPINDLLDSLPVDSAAVLLKLVHHEASQMPNGNYLALSTASHALTPEQRATFCPDDSAPFGVVSDVAVEFEPDGRVVRTWDLWDAVDVSATPGDEMCNEFFEVRGDRDWTHANAVVYDEQRDAVIFSARHTSQVIAMRHLDAEGPQTEVLWIFGEDGTIPINGDVPRYQHAVEVEVDGSILLYDNGNGRAGTVHDDPQNATYSRAVRYVVDDTATDPAEWTVTQVWEHRMNDTDGEALYAPFIGDADMLPNGNVLITHGGIDFMNPESYLHTAIVEVVPDGAAGGDIVWEFRAGSADQLVTTYRSERIESFYVGPDWVTAG